MKKCSRCAEILPSEDFRKEPRVKSGLSAKCVKCINIMQKHSKHYTFEYRQELRLKKYNLTPEQALTMYVRGCDICGKKDKIGVGGMAIDHCHKTGIVRGCLCNKCNTYLGYIKDNVDIANKMHNYLLPR